MQRCRKPGGRTGSARQHRPSGAADLTFSDHVHRLISRDCVQRAAYRPKPEAGGNSLLNETMILFHDIVGVLRWPAAAPPPQLPRLLQRLWDKIAETFFCEWRQIINATEACSAAAGAYADVYNYYRPHAGGGHRSQ